ncbi:MAG: DUF3098 domain-containing protein [candidate division Zixibacteria bacterium]|nr:DUF3098 domain-containing protein [candidate division Zixibacteria bacterium]NIT52208.1 DUF3098 domain-containing protein [candidate division Zixibacteria bacterium]NIW40202.1 hypothetical protein [candidate division Zixibacteria bacterium]NIX57317.1 hypothetical protein [candidate division Zixibacteria bacterium]
MAKKKYKVKAKQVKAKSAEVKPRKARRKQKDIADFPFGRKNYILFGAAILVLVLGFTALWMGDITIAPILLVLGYCVLIPIAILVKGRKEEPEPEAPPESEPQGPPEAEASS